jgi:GNAT superfamily N-acetyltransferase
MIAFSKEPFKVVEDNFHLIRQHWDEVVRDSRPLDPHWEMFREMEKVGALVCFVVRKEGEVVGYTVFLLQPNTHSKNTKVAFCDAVFLRKDCRKGGIGKSFLEYCDEELEKIGANMILWHVKPHVDYSPSLKAMGYTHFATVYAREIGG